MRRWPTQSISAFWAWLNKRFPWLQAAGASPPVARAAQALYREDAWLHPSDVELLNSSVVEACDTLDEAEDSLVSNTTACTQTFDVISLACADGQPEHGVCFGQAQIEASSIISASPS